MKKNMDMKSYIMKSDASAVLLLWYDFTNNDRVLVLGESLEGLINNLKSRCLYVEYKESLQEVSLLNSYSYVISIGEIKNYYTQSKLIEYINKIYDLLEKNGKLFIATDNRFGIKFFCGEPDSCTNIVFDGLNGYPHGSNKQLPSKKELDESIQKSNFNKVRFYYPLPNYNLPQEIFTDDIMPQSNINERLVPCYSSLQNIVINEKNIYLDIIENDVFVFFANSYLIECSKSGDLSTMSYSTASFDRGKKNALLTTIFAKDYVIKKAIYKEGKRRIITLSDNLKGIAKRNIKTIEFELGDGFIKMNYLKSPILSNYLKVCDKYDEIINIFDALYNNILKSSDCSNKINNIFNEYGYGIDFYGKILNKAYIEMIPLNCFIEDDELIYFDQEYFIENCPVNFVMYRVINYTYNYCSNLKNIISLTEIKNRYEISEEVWNVFEKVEVNFLNNIRWVNNKSFFNQHYTLNNDAIYENINRLVNGKNINHIKKYKIGYVPGTFDLFHIGHLNLLEKCKEKCEYLVVGINDDELVNYYKCQPPYIPYEERKRIVESLSCVDEVIKIDLEMSDKVKAWHKIHFDCHFSGSDHSNDWENERKVLSMFGVKTEFFDYTKSTSSSKIKNIISKDILFKYLNSDISNRKIVLFGAGDYFDSYMNKFGKEYKPVFALDNNNEKWGSYKYGIEIKNPKVLLSMNKEEVWIIISTAKHLEIANQLKNMGFSDFNIYCKDDFV